ncbi:putative gustatory receptor 59e [Drosophila eugracilis]|uniref:putative gustatory receptor 59e n=1 Tax=Drosophila eugracilis TaxID=29029 RepID=UPI0007E80553|nr:putative gustatory receptor 59e [Drosophila eugracilis]
MDGSCCQRWENLLLSINRFLGVSPSGRKGILHWLHSLWCLFLLLYVWAGSICKCIEFKVEMPTIEKLLYLMEFPGNMSTIAILVYYAISNHPSAHDVESQIHLVIRGLESKAIRVVYTKHGQRTLHLIVVVTGFHGLCVLVDVINSNFEFWTTWISNSVYNLPALMMSLGILQYALPVHFQWLLLERMRISLKELRLRQRPPGDINKLDARYESAFAALVNVGGGSTLLVEEMRSTCNLIEQLHKKLLSRFGIFLLLNFINSLVSFCVELYLVFNFFDNPLWNEYMLLIYRLLWLLLHGGRICFILAVNEQILEQKCNICQQLNELEVCSSHLERTINRFLLELHTSIDQPLEACGIVTLDTLSLGGFIGVLMAIVIFLIQIGLGNKSLMGVALNRSSWVYI